MKLAWPNINKEDKRINMQVTSYSIRNKRIAKSGKLTKENYLSLLLLFFIGLTIWSLIKPLDYVLWLYEALPAFFGIFLCVFFYKKIQFTSTTYSWCFIAACLMTIGAHYSYSQVPLFDWFKDVFGWNRNNYDKLGHVVQGIVPVLVSRELLVKQVRIKSVFWINLLALGVSMAISAGYEIIEWFSIFFDRRTSNDFLGTQGFLWDTQTDMLLATTGALLTIIFGRLNMKTVLKSVKD